ncbi:MAG: hypothetical protein IJZ87_10135 [Bacteroidales bacterium]|nr:hypothetical protein [Bacteroidales bacterium]
MKKSILYLISLLAMMFIAIPKISNAAPPDNPCKLVEITCPDGTQASGLVCDEEDLTFYLEYFCKLEVKIEIID